MNIPSIDIKTILEAHSSLGLVFPTNLFIGKEPSLPKICTTIFDTVGYPPQLNYVDQGYEYPSVQIRVRHTNYEDGLKLLQDITTALHGIGNAVYNGTWYAAIYAANSPAFLDWAENGCARFIVNFNIQRR